MGNPRPKMLYKTVEFLYFKSPNRLFSCYIVDIAGRNPGRTFYINNDFELIAKPCFQWTKAY